MARSNNDKQNENALLEIAEKLTGINSLHMSSSEIKISNILIRLGILEWNQKYQDETAVLTLNFTNQIKGNLCQK